MVKRDFSKFDMDVRFNLLAPTGDLHNGSAGVFEALCRGSIPLSPAIFMKIYNIAILSTVAAGLIVSFFYGMLAGVVVNLALFLIVEKFLPE